MDRAVDGAPPNRERRCKKASGNRRAHSESPSCLSKKFAHKVQKFILHNQLKLLFAPKRSQHSKTINGRQCTYTYFLHIFDGDQFYKATFFMN